MIFTSFLDFSTFGSCLVCSHGVTPCHTINNDKYIYIVQCLEIYIIAVYWLQKSVCLVLLQQSQQLTNRRIAAELTYRVIDKICVRESDVIQKCLNANLRLSTPIFTIVLHGLNSSLSYVWPSPIHRTREIWRHAFMCFTTHVQKYMHMYVG